MTNPSTGNQPAIQLTGLHKAYRRGSTSTPVLMGLDLTVGRAECAFLAGPSGSGKSTLLSILGCILSADKGNIQLLGENVDRLSARRRAQLRLRRLGFVFQRFHLIRGLTALENVCVPMTLLDVPKRKARRRAAELLETFGLGDKKNSHPANLSTGQCQRIALARALANEPDILLADEPTASLDADNGRQVMELFRHIATVERKTVIVVTHDTRIMPYADKVHWLEGGKIARTDVPRDKAAVPLRDAAVASFATEVTGMSPLACDEVS